MGDYVTILITRSADVLRRVEAVVASVIDSVSKNEPPILVSHNRTTWNNISFDPSKGLVMNYSPSVKTIRLNSANSAQKFALTMKVLSKVHQLVRTDTFCTKRELYYQDVKLFPGQSTLDDIVDDVACMLQVPRWNLHILATSKGLVAGDLFFTSGDGEHIDCSSTGTGVLIPNHVQGISNLQTEAEFVLVVEKDATFQLLLDQKLRQYVGPHILITGKGFPDVNTRLFVRLLWQHFRLPTLCLVDADPHGLEIMSTYKYGSKAQSFEANHLTVPSLRWLGILPSEVQRLIPSTNGLMQLTERDIKKANELLTRPYLSAQPLWKTEIEYLIKTKMKAEIQCLSQIAIDFLSNIYLPNKIRNSSWL
ncbi:hypothetical protein CAPTEDRAFT_89794 [Capitella teleta]|uniref:DNA topoisomerase (ATP-hydrolyzing) n=1 Tax=Capitella teleta TaxID=283909 RepID=R7TAB1_CAPTE|nr:hypothetical protein CAPTEDRAFT_89794 [Capitella teleta]|eukprot:ELT88325.1 hypothetical protein CAPTEDRAFT_89794 [Capitella teleta]